LIDQAVVQQGAISRKPNEPIPRLLVQDVCETTGHVIRRTAVAVDIQLSAKLRDRIVGRLTRGSDGNVSYPLTMR
jgi:hypothetical protein